MTSFSDRLLIALCNVGLVQLIASFVAIVIAFAIAYYALSLTAHGLSPTYSTDTPVGIGDCLYFSVVTISSLGYGDIRPLGFSRVLVFVEVLCGFAFLGVIVARLASAKQDHLIRRLYGSDVFQKIDEFRSIYVDLQAQYRDHFELLERLTTDDHENKTFVNWQHELRRINYHLRTHTIAFDRYLTSESFHGELLRVVSVRTLGSPLIAIRDLLGLWKALSDRARNCFWETTGEVRLKEHLRLFGKITDALSELSDDSQLHKRCRSVRSKIDAVAAIFHVGEENDGLLTLEKDRGLP